MLTVQRDQIQRAAEVLALLAERLPWICLARPADAIPIGPAILARAMARDPLARHRSHLAPRVLCRAP
jgi:hypothetical protein